MKILTVVLVGLFLSGCGVVDWLRPDPIIKYETIEVKIPVAMKSKPPEVLLSRQKIDLPRFVAPTSEGASSCLNVAGEEKTKRLLLNLHDQLRAWREWSK